MANSEDKLRSLYQQRKRQTTAPSSIRKVALDHAKYSQENSHIWPKFGKQFSFAGACVALLALGLLVRQTLMFNESPEVVQNLIDIEHQQTIPIPASRDFNQRYQDAKSDLERSQLTMAIHHKSFAMIASVGESWELKMCDRQSVAISSELLAELASNNALALNVEQGDFVEIAFSETGLIIGIEKPSMQLTC